MNKDITERFIVLLFLDHQLFCYQDRSLLSRVYDREFESLEEIYNLFYKDIFSERKWDNDLSDKYSYFKSQLSYIANKEFLLQFLEENESMESFYEELNNIISVDLTINNELLFIFNDFLSEFHLSIDKSYILKNYKDFSIRNECLNGGFLSSLFDDDIYKVVFPIKDGCRFLNLKKNNRSIKYVDCDPVYDIREVYELSIDNGEYVFCYYNDVKDDSIFGIDFYESYFEPERIELCINKKEYQLEAVFYKEKDRKPDLYIDDGSGDIVDSLEQEELWLGEIDRVINEEVDLELPIFNRLSSYINKDKDMNEVKTGFSYYLS